MNSNNQTLETTEEASSNSIHDQCRLIDKDLADRKIARTKISRATQTTSFEQTQTALILKSLRAFRGTLATLDPADAEPGYAREFVDLHLKGLGLTCSDDFLNQITSDDLVEGYDLSGFQILRNLRYMEICGYALEDIFTYPWPQLYERSQTITNALMEEITGSVKAAQIRKSSIKPHYMKERMSTTRQVCKVTFGYIAPVFAGPGAPVGFILTSQAQVVDMEPLRHELRFI